ncbi:flavoprotein [Sinanaerobacter sp. ZZT-01]|uniref:flavoprotein n=1 Tax=Sinanaerobacter sp. ZZT-01 TaxID=3111540 RepID=UPI002D78739A|nr:flavoprotein [Sinanaerobacter sp. ZZT-01]WRR94716.1 flavoprotein [Sinanaerobacter sp. ZZT-01]
MKHVLLGVTGSIAAYKAADAANQLTKDGYSVDVIMTESAVKFITPLTFQSLTKRKVYTDMFEEIVPSEIKHISLAKRAEVCVIAPASANMIGKLAAGIADDFLSTVMMAVRDKPILLAPAMNTNMYENPIVQDNLQKLQRFGYQLIEPKEALLACGDLGKGAMADVSVIVEAVKKAIMSK